MISVLILTLCVLALFLALYRIVVGPCDADRIVALDIFFSVSLALCMVASWMVQRTVFLDVGIGLALVGFVATMAWARLVERSSLEARHADCTKENPQ